MFSNILPKLIFGPILTFLFLGSAYGVDSCAQKGNLAEKFSYKGLKFSLCGDKQKISDVFVFNNFHLYQHQGEQAIKIFEAQKNQPFLLNIKGNDVQLTRVYLFDEKLFAYLTRELNCQQAICSFGPFRCFNHKEESFKITVAKLQKKIERKEGEWRRAYYLLERLKEHDCL